eukprot:CAMPEP_0171714038 /NCGR_PEP_ID=MMETSP0991-20121206/18071_1 /TAXON_ID=483369 /ORGANISM="non described non described, Strain CCMP2098" /LENGTH=106 /DNA_ID=CAMNT_0012304731 /DNA_START=159 /DNA_END=479 /DNA_ORIENTATION=-
MTAVEQGRTPPASISCRNKKGGHAQEKLDKEFELDREEAMEEYRAMRDSEPAKWSMHVHQVDQHPRCPDRIFKDRPAEASGCQKIRPGLTRQDALFSLAAVGTKTQ